MRILAITPYLAAPPDHGGRIRTWHLLRALAAGHDVVNVSGRSPSDSADSERMLRDAGIEVRSAPLDPRFGRLGSRDRIRKLGHLAARRSSLVARFRTPELARLVADAVALAPDLVILDHIWSAAFLPEAGDRRVLLSTHNVESSVLARKAGVERGPGGWLARAEAFALRRLESRIMRRSALTVVVSDEDRERCAALAPGARIEVVANGVDLLARTLLPPATPGPLRLLFLGGYDYAPNLDAGLRLGREVLPRVRGRAPAAEAILAGRDPGDGLAPLRGSPGVRLLGHVPDVMPVWADASVLVAPLAYGGGSRLKILEAWAVGRPVVSTPAGAEGLDARDGVELLIGRDPGELAAAALRIAGDPALAARLVAAGRRRVEERHGWDALARRFVEFVEAAVRAGKPPGPVA